jgi:membrane protein
LIRFMQKTFSKFNEDDCLTLAASLAFYTLFALPPLLYLLTIVISAGMTSLYGAEEAHVQAQEFLQNQASQLIGDRAAATEVGNMLEHVSQRGGVWWKSLISLAGVLVGATGLMSALQSSLNRVWRVKPDPSIGLARYFVVKRFFSLAMILGFGFVLLVSLILSSTLLLLGEFAAGKLGLSGAWPLAVNHGLTFLTGWIFFTGIFKFMPDAKVPLKRAALGGLFTVLLFTLGRAGLFLYFQIADPGEQLGSAAGAITIILLWVYYSAVILLIGAEFTVENSLLRGERTQPEEGAVKVMVKIVHPHDSAHAPR